MEKPKWTFWPTQIQKAKLFSILVDFYLVFFFFFPKEMRDCFSVYFAGCKSIYVTLVLGNLSIGRLGKQNRKDRFFFLPGPLSLPEPGPLILKWNQYQQQTWINKYKMGKVSHNAPWKNNISECDHTVRTNLVV